MSNQRATVTFTFRVTFDPTLTSPSAVGDTCAALLQNPDIFWENSNGVVEVSGLNVGAEVSYYHLGAHGPDCDGSCDQQPSGRQTCMATAEDE